MSDQPSWRQRLASFERRAEAWDYARMYAWTLVRLEMTPDYGVRVSTHVIPGEAKWFEVELCGPAPLPAEIESSLRRRVMAKEER